MTNVTMPGNAPRPATIDKAGSHLLAPVVDGILRRFNEDESRAEAALSAVAVLQALKAMGTFDQPSTQRAPVYAQPVPGQRPVVGSDIAKRLEDELRKPPAEQPKTYLQNTGE